MTYSRTAVFGAMGAFLLGIVVHALLTQGSATFLNLSQDQQVTLIQKRLKLKRCEPFQIEIAESDSPSPENRFHYKKISIDLPEEAKKEVEKYMIIQLTAEQKNPSFSSDFKDAAVQVVTARNFILNGTGLSKTPQGTVKPVRWSVVFLL